MNYSCGLLRFSTTKCHRIYLGFSSPLGFYRSPLSSWWCCLWLYSSQWWHRHSCVNTIGWLGLVFWRVRGWGGLLLKAIHISLFISSHLMFLQWDWWKVIMERRALLSSWQTFCVLSASWKSKHPLSPSFSFLFLYLISYSWHWLDSDCLSPLSSIALIFLYPLSAHVPLNLLMSVAFLFLSSLLSFRSQRSGRDNQRSTVRGDRWRPGAVGFHCHLCPHRHHLVLCATER